MPNTRELGQMMAGKRKKPQNGGAPPAPGESFQNGPARSPGPTPPAPPPGSFDQNNTPPQGGSPPGGQLTPTGGSGGGGPQINPRNAVFGPQDNQQAQRGSYLPQQQPQQAAMANPGIGTFDYGNQGNDMGNIPKWEDPQMPIGVDPSERPWEDPEPDYEDWDEQRREQAVDEYMGSVFGDEASFDSTRDLMNQQRDASLRRLAEQMAGRGMASSGVLSGMAGGISRDASMDMGQAYQDYLQQNIDNQRDAAGMMMEDRWRDQDRDFSEEMFWNDLERQRRSEFGDDYDPDTGMSEFGRETQYGAMDKQHENAIDMLEEQLGIGRREKYGDDYNENLGDSEFQWARDRASQMNPDESDRKMASAITENILGYGKEGGLSGSGPDGSQQPGQGGAPNRDGYANGDFAFGSDGQRWDWDSASGTWVPQGGEGGDDVGQDGDDGGSPVGSTPGSDGAPGQPGEATGEQAETPDGRKWTWNGVTQTWIEQTFDEDEEA